MSRILIVTDATTERGEIPNGVRVGNALRKMGHDVARTGSYPSAARLKDADIVLAFGTLIKDEARRPGSVARIASLKGPSTVLALWYFDLCHPAIAKAKHMTIRRIVPALDWLVTTDHSYPWEQHAKHYLHLMQGVDPDEYAGAVAPPEPRYHDVIFTGALRGPATHGRAEDVAAMRRAHSVVVYGRGGDRQVYGRRIFDAYQRARVAYVPAPEPAASKDYWSNRVYMATATGTPCVVGYADGLERHFEDGREAIFFRTRAELVDAVRALVSDPERRRAIGNAARERTLREHTYEARCRTLMETICKS